MTELSIRPDEIRDALQKFVADYQPSAASVEEVGVVADAGDGIAHVEGLPSAMANELLEFEDGTLGLALNLDTRDIGVVILGVGLFGKSLAHILYLNRAPRARHQITSDFKMGEMLGVAKRNRRTCSSAT